MTDTGWSICKDNDIVAFGSICPKGSISSSDKRKYISNGINDLISKHVPEVKIEPNKVVVLIERVRLTSQGFLSLDYIKSNAALVCLIVDFFHEYGIKTYSVDTRSWKSQIVGTSKGVKEKKLVTRGKNKGKYKYVENKKKPTLDYVQNILNIDVEGNDNVADAICISRYAFLPKSVRKLKLEK